MIWVESVVNVTCYVGSAEKSWADLQSDCSQRKKLSYSISNLKLLFGLGLGLVSGEVWIIKK